MSRKGKQHLKFRVSEIILICNLMYLDTSRRHFTSFLFFFQKIGINNSCDLHESLQILHEMSDIVFCEKKWKTRVPSIDRFLILPFVQWVLKFKAGFGRKLPWNLDTCRHKAPIPVELTYLPITWKFPSDLIIKVDVLPYQYLLIRFGLHKWYSLILFWIAKVCLTV